MKQTGLTQLNVQHRLLHLPEINSVCETVASGGSQTTYCKTLMCIAMMCSNKTLEYFSYISEIPTDPSQPKS